MTGILDQLQISGVRATRFTIMNGERPKESAFARKQRPRPRCSNSKRQEPVTIMIPDRVSENVIYIDRFLPIDGCATGSTLWTDRHRSCVSDKSWKAGRSCTIKLLPVIMRKPDGTQCPVTKRFNQLSNDCEHFCQRSSRENQPQNVEHRFGGKQT